MIRKTIKTARRHPFVTGFAVLLLFLGGYFGVSSLFKKNGEVRYVFAEVKRGDITVAVSGSGQVAVSNQIDVKTKVSGDVAGVFAENGAEALSGTLLAQINTRDAEKTVRDTQVTLEKARIDLEKLRGPEGSAIPRNKEVAESDLKKAHEDGFNAVANAFLDLPDIVTALHDILFETDTGSQWNIDYYADSVKNYSDKVLQYKDDAASAYDEAKAAYDNNFENYKSTSRYSETALLENLINETYDTTRAIAEAVKSAANLIQLYKEEFAARGIKPHPIAETHLSSLSTHTGKTNTHLLNILAAKTAIQDGKDAILNADLDIRAQELAVTERENALLDAREKLLDYFIRAPFSGIVASMEIKKGDSISANALAATLITAQQIAEISLNEIDAARVRIGEKTMLTFDAVPDLRIAGKVAEIDTIGTVSQGVVSYIVKIAFDAQDSRIKPAMSVSADIKYHGLKSVVF